MGPSPRESQDGRNPRRRHLFDDSFLRYWKQEYEVMTPQTLAELFGHSSAKLATSRS